MDSSSFIQEIITNPNDDVARMVFADFLEEQEDPRAEMIRIQFELADLDAFDPRRRKLRARELQLLRKHGIFGDTISVAEVVGHHGGFIDAVKLTVTRFLKHQDVLFQQAPIRELHLKSKAVRFGEIKESKYLKQLSKLVLKQNDSADEETAELICCSGLKDLRRLFIQSSTITSDAVIRIAENAQLERLEHLELQAWLMDSRAATAISRSPVFSSLRQLSLNGDQGDRAMVAISQSEHLTQLEQLTLSGDIGSEGLTAIQGASFVSQLQSLDIYAQDLEAGVLHSETVFPSLKHLVFRYNFNTAPRERSRDLLAALLCCCPHLETLNLAGDNIFDDQLPAIIENPVLRNLKKLVLTQNCLTLDGVRMLATSPNFPKSIRLYLRSNHLSKKDIRALRKEFGKTFGNMETERELKWLR